MKTSHEWPPPPCNSSSLRRKLARESLASVDWCNGARRFESYSDGDDESLTQDPPQAPACERSGHGKGTGLRSSGTGECGDSQSSGYVKGIAFQSSGFAGNHEGLRLGEVQEVQSSNQEGLESAVYGNDESFDFPSNTIKIISSNKEGKTKVPANRRVNHSSACPQQPLRLHACPFSGALKLAGKPHTARLTITTHMASKESAGFDTREPFSPEVTCLGRVRIKEKQGHDSEHAHMGQQASRDLQRPVLESKKQSVDKNHKDVLRKSSSKKETAEKRSCLPRIKRREDVEFGRMKLFGPSSSTVIPSENMETRRDRAALLARSLTSLLEDLRRLDMENSEYVPAVPPPNSLLLMKGFGALNKSCNQEIPSLCNVNSRSQSEETNGIVNENSCEDSSGNAILLDDVNMQKGTKPATRIEGSDMAAQSKAAMGQHILPLSEIESDPFVRSASPSEMSNERPLHNCSQEPALWQRRAIGKLDALDTKGLIMRMEIKQPRTK